MARPNPIPAKGYTTSVVSDGVLVIADNSPLADPFVTSDLADYALYAFRLVDGGQAWRVSTGGKLAGSPQISGGRVYAVTWDMPAAQSEEPASSIHCIEMATGRVLWSSRILGAHAGPPAVGSGIVVVPGRELQVALGYDAASGVLRWQTSLLPSGDALFEVAAPAILDSTAYLADGEHLYALDVPTGRQLWRLN